MIKPESLKIGDKVALVSLSSGGLGDEKNKERLQRTIDNIQNALGLEVVFTPNSLIGSKEVYEHPELRAKDLMDAFEDDSIKAIWTLTGGNDTVRLLPYIDFDVIKNHPKIFMGFSDTTVNHFMMYKAGLTSYYGPAAGVEFSLKEMFKENTDTVINTLFNPQDTMELSHYSIKANDPEDWSKGITKIDDSTGYEVVQGSGIVAGALLGGCIDVFPMIIGTSIWPSADEWKDKILFIETSEEQPSPDLVKYIFYNLGAQGILNNINGILVGRPKDGKYYQEYNEVIKEVTRIYGRSDIPIIANCHFGHAWLWNILPIGTEIQLDCNNKTIKLVESPVKRLDNKTRTL